jgi:hypothetical protein
MPKWREELSLSGEYANLDEMMDELNRLVRLEQNKRFEKIDRFYNTLITRQLNFNQYISRISATASYIYASTHLAGNGVQDFIGLLSDVDRFQQSYLDIKSEQEEKIAKAQGQNQGRRRESNAYDASLWPTFEPKPISLAVTLNQSWVDIALLCGGTVLLLLVAFIGFMRYDPR